MRRAASFAFAGLLVALATAAWPVAALAQPVPKPTVERAWARATPPGVNVGAAYLTIRNAGPRADQVIALRSPVSERAEIHETRISGDIMQMRQITEATVPAGGLLALEPGGTHVMLIGLRSPLLPGATVPLVLTFRHAGEVQVKALLQAPGSDPPSQ